MSLSLCKSVFEDDKKETFKKKHA